MCGIWISLGYPPDKAHLDEVSHRGPDGDGWREFETRLGPLAFGHRRLAIIDTGDGGIQPMSYAEGRYWITYNGEIYNYLELRDELRALGYKFLSHSDTEVILAAYAAWGRGALPKLRGMFALAIYDLAAGKVLLARDRFGIKPLYYVETPKSFAAGSEIKQLLMLPGVTRRINQRRAYDFLAGGMLDHSEETMFADVVQLLPGEWIELNMSARTERGKWYQFPQPGSLVLNAEEASARFFELLQDSVRLHLRADVDVGSCLSGGLDSSALVMLMSEQLAKLGSGNSLNSVTARFEGTSVDGTRYADLVACAASAKSHAARPRSEDVMQEAKDIVWHQDEPYGSTSIHAQWHVFATTRANDLKVMLDGQGADEILAGYHGAYDVRLAELLKKWRLSAAFVLASRRARWLGVPFSTQLATGAARLNAMSPSAIRRPLNVVASVLRRRRTAGTAISQEPWLQNAAFGVQTPYNVFDRALADAGLLPATEIATLCNALTQVGNVRMLLHWEDRNSMAHGVEARVPFLDHPLVEFAIALGGEHKLVDGWTKWVLRDAMKGRLSEEVRLRKDKLGFATPEASWLRGPMRGQILDALEATRKRFPDHFNGPGLRAMSEDMLEGRRTLDFTLWRVACFGLWSEQFSAAF